MNESAYDSHDDHDEVILAQLAELYDSIDPPPEHLTEEIVFSLSLAALDAELATLQDASELSIRSQTPIGTDTVTFTSSALQLMVSYAEDAGGGLRIDGWVTGGGITVELLQNGTTSTATSDSHGRLVWREVPRGTMRFLMRPPGPDARPVLTPVIDTDG